MRFTLAVHAILSMLLIVDTANTLMSVETLPRHNIKGINWGANNKEDQLYGWGVWDPREQPPSQIQPNLNAWKPKPQLPFGRLVQKYPGEAFRVVIRCPAYKDDFMRGLQFFDVGSRTSRKPSLFNPHRRYCHPGA